MSIVGTLIAFLLGAILLGVGQWIFLVIRRWFIRRKRRRGRTIRIVVLVDRMRKAHRRTCFWRSVFRRNDYDFRHRIDLRYLSISDELDKRRNPAATLFTVDSADLIIVNWDAMNGDPAFASDRTYSFLEHYRPDMGRWLREGGVLVVESQGISWGGSQKPYDCIIGALRASHVKVHEALWCVGDRVSVSPTHRRDPLAAGLVDLHLQPGGLWSRRDWFPKRMLRGSVESLAFARRHQRVMYRGWFDEWSEDWIPVLVRGNLSNKAVESGESAPSEPVLLYRRVAPDESTEPGPTAGYVILTTLFIASSELNELIDNILDLTHHVDRR